MAGSQITKVEAMSDLTGLTHDVFVGRVLGNVQIECPTSMLFQNAGPGEYHMEGQKMRFAADYDFATGAMATGGNLPDHQGLDPLQGYLTPIRRYRRIAADSLVLKQATGAGAFEDFGQRLFDILWGSWKRMEIRHSIGAPSCLVAVVDARTSSTVFTIKDAFGHAGTNPMAHITKGSVLCWYDVSGSAIAGAGIVADVDEATKELTMDSGTTWEPSAQIATGDGIYFATTNSITSDYFDAEKDQGPNGLGLIVDPDANYTSAFDIAEADAPRSKPYRKASTTFDHLELTSHWLQLGQHRGFDVTPATDVLLTFPSCVDQVARSLMGYQQQAYTGGDLRGGWTGVTVNGIPLVGDGFFYHDVAVTLWKDGLKRVNLGGEADMWAEDGNEWNRIADFDGREAFAGEYLNTFETNRGANGCLTSIVTEVSDEDYTTVPDY